MFSASLVNRLARCFATYAILALVAPAAQSQTVSFSLNVDYAVNSDVNSGGNWQLVAKGTNAGIAAINVRLTGINAGAVNQAPRGKVNGTDDAGFTFDEFFNGTYRTISANQIPVFPTGGEEESAFYGIGTLTAGVPGALGPMFTSLTNVQGDVPWGNGDDFKGQSDWAKAVIFASGSFPINVTPAFFAGSTASVFQATGSSMSFGPAVGASISILVRTDFSTGATLPDYNHNGVVDTADYVLWRKGSLQADGTGNGIVDVADYNLWVEHFGEIVPGGGGGGTSVPEPAAALLVISALVLQSFSRRRRFIKPRPVVARRAGRFKAPGIATQR